MLKVFRENLKYLNWILWLVIVIFVAFIFVDWGIGGLGRSENASYAAKVGSATVSMQEFERTYKQLEAQYREVYGERFTPEVAKQMQLPMQALDRLVSRQILLQEAETMDLSVSDDELRRAILAVDAFKTSDGVFVGDEDYAAILRQNGQSVAAFERNVRADLLVRKLTGALEKTVQVPDNEVEKAYRARAERAAMRFIVVPDTQAVGQVSATDQELKVYYDAHRDDFRLDDQRLVDYLLVDVPRLQQGIQVSPTEARAYYDAHTADFDQPEQVRARHILLKVDDKRGAEEAQRQIEALRKRLAAGEDFATLAAASSEDVASAQRGGELGFFGRGQMVPEFEQAAFAAQPGELVGPVKTSFGYHLIQVEEKRAGGTRPFEEMAPQIENRLRQERAQTEAETKAKALYKKLAAGPEAGEKELKALADAEPSTLGFATTPPFGRDDLVPGIGRQTAFSSTAFALEQGKLSEPVKVPRGWAILHLREVRPPRVPEFSEAEVQVRQVVERQKRVERSLAELRSARAAIAGGKTLDAVAQELGVAVQDSGEFGENDPIRGLGIVPEVTKEAIAAQSGAIGGPVATPQGAVLFQVTERKRFDPIEFAAQRTALRESLQQQEFGRLLQALIEKRRAEMTVNYNRQLLQQFGILDETPKAS
jgi:peptidyl-prolyl cis-trans isomerase D